MVVAELLEAAEATREFFSPDTRDANAPSLVGSEEEEEEFDQFEPMLRVVRQRKSERCTGVGGFINAGTVDRRFNAKSYFGANDMHPNTVAYVKSFRGGDLGAQPDVPCMLCGNVSDLMLVCERCGCPVCTACLWPRTNSIRLLRKAGDFFCHCCLASETSSESDKKHGVEALHEAEPVAESGANLGTYVQSAMEGMRVHIGSLAESFTAYVQQSESARTADLHRFEGIESTLTELANVVKASANGASVKSKKEAGMAPDAFRVGATQTPAILKTASVQDRVGAAPRSTQGTAPASGTLFNRVVAGAGSSGTARQNTIHRQLARNMLVENGIKDPTLSFYPQGTREVTDPTTGDKYKITEKWEKSAAKWTFNDFIRKCTMEQTSASSEEDATFWHDLMTAVSDFTHRCHSWEDGGHLYFLMIFELIADDKLEPGDLKMGSAQLLNVHLRVNTELLKRQTEAAAKAKAKPAPAKAAPAKQRTHPLSAEHFEKFKLWRDEADHSTKCPECAATYDFYGCCAHYKQCPQLEDLRRSHM